MKIFLTLITLISLIFFMGCSSNSGPGGESRVLLDNQDTLAIIVATDNSLTLENTRAQCENGVFSQETNTFTTQYELVDGNLLTWEEGDCAKIIYTGNNTGLNGTWNSVLDTVSTGEPNCTPGDVEENLQYLKNPSRTLVISDSTVEVSSSGEFCMAEMLGDEILEDGGIEFGGVAPDSIKDLQVSGCSSLSFTQVQGPVEVPISATFSDLNEKEMQAVVTAGNCPVTATLPKGEPTEETCSAESPFEDPEWQSCVITYIFENNCLADAFVEQFEPPAANIFISEVNVEATGCQTFDLNVTALGQIITANGEFLLEEGEPVISLVSGGCSTTMPLDGDIMEDQEFLTCVMEENDLTMGGLGGSRASSEALD